jgi:hypothetical protein
MPISTIGSNSLNQTSDLTINGQTVGKGGGNVATNTAHGLSALAGANSGSGNNTAVGYLAAYNNTTGTENTVVGTGSFAANTTGSYNSALGRDSLVANTTGSNNVAVGRQALNGNTTASNNTAVGYQAGYANTTGASNAFIGYQAGTANTTGSQNSYLGYFAGGAMTTGSSNTIVGRFTGNQGGLDIRTSSNNIVLSDGDGNPRFSISGQGNHKVYPAYSGSLSSGSYTTLVSSVSGNLGTAIKIYGHLSENGINNASFGEWLAVSNGSSWTLNQISQAVIGNSYGTLNVQFSGDNLQIKSAANAALGQYSILIEIYK